MVLNCSSHNTHHYAPTPQTHQYGRCGSLVLQSCRQFRCGLAFVWLRIVTLGRPCLLSRVIPCSSKEALSQPVSLIENGCSAVVSRVSACPCLFLMGATHRLS